MTAPTDRPFAPKAFPHTRLRRTRRHDWSRRLVSETSLSVNDLIWPVFVIEGDNEIQIVPSMPGVFRYTIDKLVEACAKAYELGIPAVALFPRTNSDVKDWEGSEASNPENLICRAVRALKANLPDLGVVCDVALDPYTTTGHDGIVRDGYVVNDESVAALCQQALIQAQAGCDIVAPSDMMDGRIRAIRDTLDFHGFIDVQICSYAAKYASGFYGPFRDAIGSGTQLQGGDKKTYQMDPANTDEALREVATDLEEGADIVMIKPGMPYLDIIQRVSSTFKVPTWAYQVSGEYAMLRGAMDHGWLDPNRVVLESLMCFRRAGAGAILTYFAPDAAQRLKEG